MPLQDREERFRMRQRGAGTHKVQNVDFGLSFPVLGSNIPLPQTLSSRSTRPSRPTPNTNRQQLPPQRSSRRTPGPAQAQHQPVNSSGKRRGRPPKQSNATPGTTRNQHQSGTSSGKRRGRPPKQSTATPVSTQTQPRPSISSGKRRGRPPKQSNAASGPDRSIAKRRKLDDDDFEARPTTRPAATNDPSSSARSTRSTRLADREGIRSTRAIEVERDARQGRSQGADIPAQLGSKRPRPRQIQQNQPNVASDPASELDDVLSDRSPPRPNDDNIDDDSAELDATAPTSDDLRSTRHRQSLHHANEDSSIEVQERTTSVGATPGPRRGRGRPPGSKNTPKSGTRPAPPATGKRGRGRPRKDSTSVVKSSRPKNKSKHSESTSGSRHGAIPVLVHRLHVPTRRDDVTSQQKFIRPSGVNAVDVLAQICREYIDAASGMIQEQEDDPEAPRKARIAYRRKRKAVEAFGGGFDEKCFELSEAVDHNQVISTRVRHAKKELAEWEEERIRLREERERVGEKMDEVRKRHEERGVAATEQIEINREIQDVELAIQRGRDAHERKLKSGDAKGEEDPLGNLEMLLKTVASDVSSQAGDGVGGLLKRVREFNAFLERTAGVFEGSAR